MSARTKSPSAPSIAEQLVSRGVRAMNAGDYATAERDFRRSRHLQPNALADAALGYTLLERVRTGESGVLALACEHLAQGYTVLGDPFFGLGYADALTKLGCHAMAREVLTAVVAMPDDGRNLPIVARFLLAHLNAADGRPSADDFLALADVEAQDPYAVFYRALIRLWDGRWAEGWADYHARWQVPALRSVWRGPPVEGTPLLTPEQARDHAWLGAHPILIWQEQGLGDVAFGLPWLAVLDRLGVPYQFAASTHGAEIAHAMRGALGQPPLAMWDGEAARVHAQCPLFSVPHLFGIPVPPVSPARPAAPTTGDDDLGTPGRICVKLTGNPQHGNDADRSCRDPLARAYLATALHARRTEVIDLDVAPLVGGWSWADTIRALTDCRALLTVDTAVANIAAVLGVRTILIPQTMPEFRWGRYDTVAWAPSVTIVRRAKRDDWLSTIARAFAYLTQG